MLEKDLARKKPKWKTWLINVLEILYLNLLIVFFFLSLYIYNKTKNITLSIFFIVIYVIGILIYPIFESLIQKNHKKTKREWILQYLKGIYILSLAILYWNMTVKGYGLEAQTNYLYGIYESAQENSEAKESAWTAYLETEHKLSSSILNRDGIVLLLIMASWIPGLVRAAHRKRLEDKEENEKKEKASSDALEQINELKK